MFKVSTKPAFSCPSRKLLFPSSSSSSSASSSSSFAVVSSFAIRFFWLSISTTYVRRSLTRRLTTDVAMVRGEGGVRGGGLVVRGGASAEGGEGAWPRLLRAAIAVTRKVVFFCFCCGCGGMWVCGGGVWWYGVRIMYVHTGWTLGRFKIENSPMKYIYNLYIRVHLYIYNLDRTR